MRALSRLKATFEACLGVFRQNMETLGRDSRRSDMRKPRHRVRHTQCARYSALDQSNIGLRKMHEWGPPQVEGHACRQSGSVAGRKQVFSGSDGGLGRGVWTGLCAWCHSLASPQVQRWPCGYSPSIQSYSPLDVPCHCSFTQPNTCIRSLAASAAGIPLSLWGHHHGWPVPGAASPPCLSRRCFIQSWQHGRADLAAMQESRVWWRQNEDNLPHWAGAVKVVLLTQPSSAVAKWVFFLLQAAFSGHSSMLHSGLCGDQCDASLQSSPRQ